MYMKTIVKNDNYIIFSPGIANQVYSEFTKESNYKLSKEMSP